MYAIVEAKGQQFKIGQGDTIKTEKMAVEVGETVTLDRVLLLAKDNGEVLIGSPVVDGARAVATVVEHGRGKKIIVFRFKAKSNYRRKTGHRQDYTKLLIEEIKSE
ncbi:MAG: 50S ribosomal protein L21 [Bacillota bacterium]|nr:50S ribosomal protein L21 [Bacillota bacterium]